MTKVAIDQTVLTIPILCMFFPFMSWCQGKDDIFKELIDKFSLTYTVTSLKQSWNSRDLSCLGELLLVAASSGDQLHLCPSTLQVGKYCHRFLMEAYRQHYNCQLQDPLQRSRGFCLGFNSVLYQEARGGRRGAGESKVTEVTYSWKNFHLYKQIPETVLIHVLHRYI